MLKVIRYVLAFTPTRDYVCVRSLAMESRNQEPDLDREITKSFLSLEKIDHNIYRANKLWKTKGAKNAFGGQIIGQALVAATKTVPDDLHIHSLHAYFIRGGDVNKSVVYHVDRNRDGLTYSNRGIKATQDGMAIFSMHSSFKKDEESVYSHQYKMPTVPSPETLLNSEEILQVLIESGNLTTKEKAKAESYVNNFFKVVPLETKPTEPHTLFGTKCDPKRNIWIRAAGHIGEDMNMHRCVLAYMSDFFLLGASTMPAGQDYKMRMASLDHSLWFHNPFHANEWMLYETESPHCGSGRGFSIGRLWREDGVLAVSVAQEGMIRAVL